MSELKYVAHIQRNSDGERREYSMTVSPEYRGTQKFWWSRRSGNGGCDCNRRLFFERAVDPEYDDDLPCGDIAYTVEKLVFEDGAIVVIDAEPLP